MGNRKEYNKLKHLFSPIVIGSAQIRNRIAMAPMGNHLQTEEGFVTDELVAYLEARAEGQVGLLITPFASVVSGQPTFGAYCDEMVEGLTKLASAIKSHGSAPFLQIAHLGAANPNDPVASTAFQSRFYSSTPRAMPLDEVRRTIEQFGDAARRAKEAGFSGIELHGGYAYLVASFYSPYLNQRTDMYGGFEGGMNFLSDIMGAIRKNAGDLPVGFKLNAHEHVPGGIDLPCAIEIAGRMEAMGADYLHVVAIVASDSKCEFCGVQTTYHEGNHLASLAGEIRRTVKIPVVAAGSIDSPAVADDLIKRGVADIVAIGRGLIAEPEWPRKAREGMPYRPCIRCNVRHTHEVIERSPVRCTVNPLAGRELQYPMNRVREPLDLVVVGGGPAGIHAALTATRRGHRVSLYDERNRLGGMMQIAAIPKFKKPLQQYLRFLIDEIEQSEVEIHLEARLQPDDLSRLQCDAVIIATGSQPVIPKIPGLVQEAFVTARELLQQPDRIKSGESVIVLGASKVGCEIAWYIADELKGCPVLIDTQTYEDLMVDAYPRDRVDLLSALRELGVPLICQKDVIGIEDHCAIMRNEVGERSMMDFETLVLAVGAHADNSFEEELRARNLNCHILVAGDCVQPRDIYSATQEGFQVAYDLAGR